MLHGGGGMSFNAVRLHVPNAIQHFTKTMVQFFFKSASICWTTGDGPADSYSCTCGRTTRKYNSLRFVQTTRMALRTEIYRVPYSQLPKQRKRRNIPPSILPGCSWPSWYLQSTDSELFVFNQCTDTMVDDYELLFTVAPGFSDLIWMITLETLFVIKCQQVQQS